MSTKIRADKVFQDLFRMGDYSSWSPPKTLENIKWFKDKGYDLNRDYQNIDILKSRMVELFQSGVSPTNKTYLVANVNREDLLKFVLDNGADPNLKGKTGLSVCYRAISRGRTDLVRLLISSEQFNFNESLVPNIDNHNVLLAALIKGRVDLAKDIIAVNPDLISKRDSNGLGVFDAIAEYINEKSNFPENKIRSILELMHKHFNDKNLLVESNTNNDFINAEIATLNAIKLSKELSESQPNKRGFKI